MFNRKQLYAQAKQWLDILKVELDLRRSVEDLPVAQQQIVEIVKAISYDADIIVMDEPTAALAPHEVANLFKYIDVLKCVARRSSLFPTVWTKFSKSPTRSRF